MPRWVPAPAAAVGAGFDDLGAVLVEAKNAVAAARQQQQAQTSVAYAEPASTSSGGDAASASATPLAGLDVATTSYTTPGPSLGDVQATNQTAPTAAAAAAEPMSWVAEQEAPAAAAADVGGGGRGVALYEFVAEMPGELSVSAGDELELIGAEVDGWYNARVRSDPSRVGLIPASYVQVQ
jgi:hypothetical protein